MYRYHSASAELYSACLLERMLGSGRGVVGWSAVERIAGVEMVVVVWVAAVVVVAAAAEGLVVDRTAALAVAAVVPVGWSQVAVVAVE